MSVNITLDDTFYLKLNPNCPKMKSSALWLHFIITSCCAGCLSWVIQQTQVFYIYYKHMTPAPMPLYVIKAPSHVLYSYFSFWNLHRTTLGTCLTLPTPGEEQAITISINSCHVMSFVIYYYILIKYPKFMTVH